MSLAYCLFFWTGVQQCVSSVHLSHSTARIVVRKERKKVNQVACVLFLLLSPGLHIHELGPAEDLLCIRIGVIGEAWELAIQ